MISLTPATALMLYLSLALSLILGFWIYHHLRRRKLTLVERALFLCEYCSSSYLQETTKSVTRCPHCLAYNKKLIR